jgi:hypothetical protein
MESGETERVEIAVAQGLLDRRVECLTSLADGLTYYALC